MNLHIQRTGRSSIAWIPLILHFPEPFPSPSPSRTDSPSHSHSYYPPSFHLHSLPPCRRVPCCAIPPFLPLHASLLHERSSTSSNSSNHSVSFCFRCCWSNILVKRGSAIARWPPCLRNDFTNCSVTLRIVLPPSLPRHRLLGKDDGGDGKWREGGDGRRLTRDGEERRMTDVVHGRTILNFGRPH